MLRSRRRRGGYTELTPPRRRLASALRRDCPERSREWCTRARRRRRTRTVVEVAAALARWLPDPRSPEPSAFRYTSSEAEESPLIAFEPEDDGWVLISPWLAADQPRPLLITEIALAAEDFVSRVASAVERDLGIDIQRRLTAEPGEIDIWEIDRSALSPTDRR